MTAFAAVIARPFICLSIAHGCTRADLLRSALFLCTLPLFSTGRLLICYTGTIIQRRRIRHEAQQYPSAVQLEERYGSRTLLSGILMTALVSGIVFMLIMLSSLAGSRNGGIPITLILVGALYLSQQVYDILFVQCSQLYAHRRRRLRHCVWFCRAQKIIRGGFLHEDPCHRF